MCKYLPTLYQEYIFKSRYARWLPDKKRRETWEETVARYFDFFEEHLKERCNYTLTKEERRELEKAVLNLEVMPSMRCLMTAGKALKISEAAGYNCSFMVINSPKVFSEALYLLMVGCGVGFSVERQYINQLPIIEEEFHDSNTVIVVDDSKIGWAKAYKELVGLLYQGQIPKFDVSRVRPAGTALKTFGGRASGPGPLTDLLNFTISIFKNAAGRKLNSVECHDLMCAIGMAVVVGGTRRSATISLSNLSDDRMRQAKTGKWWELHPQRALANNSACYNEKPDIGIFMDEWKSLYDSKSGERGIFNLDGARKHAAKNGREKPELIQGTNPCITGETLVYVADGRGFVPISSLAETGEDVPVFCWDDQHRVQIRQMRNPRITGTTEVYKITLENGHEIRATGNHKFHVNDFGYKQMEDLLVGDSLGIITRYEATMNEVFKTGSSSEYYFVNNGLRANVAEHRYIAGFYNNIVLRGGDGFVVHHKDHNTKNNVPSNLEIMRKEEHDEIHRASMLGDNNPMRRAAYEWSEEKWEEYREKQSKNNMGDGNPKYSGISDDEIRQHAIELTKSLGRRFSTQEWRTYSEENGLPRNYSKWRKNSLGVTFTGISKWAAIECGIDSEILELDPRIVRKYKNLLKAGYDCFLKDGGVCFNLVCEVCGEPFVSKHREKSICSLECHHNTKKYEEGLLVANKAQRATLGMKKEIVRNQQVKLYTKLRAMLGREPEKIEWVDYCRQSGTSPEISRKSSPFRYYKDLREVAGNYNHRIIRIEKLGPEVVYNGTVDEFHNFFVGGFEESQRNGKKKWVCVNNLNCGEVLLRNAGLCNLSSVVIKPEDTLESLKRKIRLAATLGTFQATLTNFKYLSSSWQKNAEEERLIGVSLNGIMDNELLNGTKGKKNLPSMLDDMKNAAIDANKEWSSKLGIPSAQGHTSVKPEGTTSQLVNSASGIHPRFSPYYIRTIRADNKDPLCRLMKDLGFPSEPDVTKPEATTIFSFPVKSPNGSVFRNEISAIDQLELWLIYKNHWTNHTVSITVYVREHEWLDVAAWVYRHFDDVTGVSFLPHTEHVYKQAPFQECTKEQYEELSTKMPKEIDWSLLSKYETEDQTTSAKELACVAGVCDLA